VVIKPKVNTRVQRTAGLNQSRGLPPAGEELYEVSGGRLDELVTRLLNRLRFLETGERGQPRRRKTGAKEKEKQTAFLRAFGESCSLVGAAQLVGIKLATHHRWLATDSEYKDEFEATIPMASGVLEDSLIQLARYGWFQPLIYQGEFQYAMRKRTICQLADGNTAFEDELPKGARVTGRRTVSTRDGEMLGRYRHDGRLLLDLLAKWMPEEFGAGRKRSRGPVRGSAASVAALGARRTLAGKGDTKCH